MDAVDVHHPGKPPASGITASPPLRNDSTRNVTSLRRPTRDSRPKRLGSSAGKAAASPPKLSSARLPARIATAAPATTTGKPLLPATERLSREEKALLRPGREAEADKDDVAPDGSSAGREGRQFTVANVGNNGRIYLRPTVRLAHQRYPQPNFVFPVTPPGAGGLNQSVQGKPPKNPKGARPPKPLELDLSQWTPTPTASPLVGEKQYFPDARGLNHPTRQRRAMSDTTMQEYSAAAESDKDTFKVVISRPAGEEQRPRTMDDLDATAGPLLNINIPSWRIGTPRFTLRGTPIIRGSSYAPTEDIRSSSVSLLDPSSKDYGVLLPKPRPRGIPLAATRPPQSQVPSQQSQPHPPPSPKPSPPPVRDTYISTHLVIEPGMFNDLTFEPACDDRSIVRYSPAGAVTAATPPRLVAEITSPSFLDYELISDFFLTYRAFLEPVSLLRMLVARLRWALARTDERGMIVRVRTFVAVRHWILNYFTDDFIYDYDLRETFCTLLNEFVEEVSQDQSSRKVQLKILAELKKCWRRICAQYWDGSEFDDSLGPEVPISPGGVAEAAEAEQGDMDAAPVNVSRSMPKVSTSTDPETPYIEGEQILPVGDLSLVGHRPGTPQNRVSDGAEWEDVAAGSPLSMASMDIVSCSFPSKTLKALNPNATQLMAAHPVPATSAAAGAAQVATTPKALTGKRVRPAQTHKRNNSISDSLRDHGSDRSSSHDQDLSTMLPSAGSLVRGNLLPPGQAYVDYEPFGPYSSNNRQTTIFQPSVRELPKLRNAGGAMSGNGMKKLIGSVRRAIRARGSGVSPTEGHFMTIAPVGPRGATTNRLPGTAVVPMGRPRNHAGRPPVRIDLLGAEVAEDFKKAVREEEAAAQAEAQRLEMDAPPKSAPPYGGHPDYSAALMDSSTFDGPSPVQRPRSVSDMGITVGSKSIVIVDDTVPFEMAPPQGHYPTVANPSVDTFADAFMTSAADPTPPNTPPSSSLRGNTPRRSSFLLNQHVRTSLIQDALPPFIPDLATLEGTRSTRGSEDAPRPSLSTSRPARRPPVSGVALRMHKKSRSKGAPRSLNSIIHRNYSSFGSGSALPATVLSFDATTDSGASATDAGSDVPIPAPLHVLRRRPGGDLRSANHVADLDRASLRRSRSVGSLAAYTDSIRSSYLLDTRPDSAGNSGPLSPRAQLDHDGAFSVGQLADRQPIKRNLSLFSTHSSKPIMRPSFEAEAQKLAQIPDDDDDGGIESALAKLEGKYDKKTFKRSVEVKLPDAGEEDVERARNEREASVVDSEALRQEKHEKRHLHIMDEQPNTVVDQAPDMMDQVPPKEIKATSRRGLKSFLSVGSQGSYCSIPLLERDFTDGARSRIGTMEWTDRSVLRGSDDSDSLVEVERDPDGAGAEPGQHLSFDLVEKTASIERIKSGELAPSETENQSFLDDASANDTDLSSELSVEGIGAEDSDNDLFGKYQSPNLIYRQSTSRTSTHQMTLAQALSMSPGLSKRQDDRDGPVAPAQPLLPSPELTPTLPQGRGHSSPDLNEPGDSNPSRGAPGFGNIRKYSVHLPFILAFDSDILAQQFTLIEKDALNEIDWKELIDMNWKNAARSDSRSWVHYLQNSEAQGVEVVIARFNIMVKWAISEIVLTQHIEERARCIIKLIHIASHCRRYRNFATLAQLAIALSSNEISRLTQTWKLVPAHDVKTLNSLEALVTPSRNFHAIRAEMEMGSDAGCIPFVGIYTHDLLYNAQRPSEIASSPMTAPLVNFERCRIAAAVVKTLLRLLEASTRYSFVPIEGITERCLWVGALSDDEIRRHSESLE
ncbi:Guanine nucleotide exchange factor lte1 [Purpureocillium takamizusanense]|uniref:Guanine nucleotide exchange factor lte1 n=1 Tax=Purpureocillium takamizusanense TaxID=2060973 RepID=A0A9Q8QFI6_9HYPO|nr:Guanine nucleotide exchange factor lte1 [Purpureocillium takamizusanense]UNI19884.1 Guanine nucleotide exchange factor lte1 [Purpureocillium takamizusanense]